MPWPENTVVNEAQRADWDARFGESDAFLGIETTQDFEPFSQINDMFVRSMWDPDVQSEAAAAFFDSYRYGVEPRKTEGFSQKDFALRNASWSLSDIISNRSAENGIREGFQGAIADDTPKSPHQFEVTDRNAQSDEIKRIAKIFGASLVGITEVDERWHYRQGVDVRDASEIENPLPDSITHVIVMAHEMDFDLVETYPSALAGASTGREYSHEAAICIQVSAYIRGLGYDAVASMNDTALVIPYAIKAGLGEYGRNQMVLTREFGPRVRFSKIFTSLPLVADKPRKLGLASYCHSCTKCAAACPPKALPFGAPEVGSDSKSTVKGVKKWSANCEKCFGYWTKIKTDCGICMRVCPFNREYDRWQDRLWRWLAVGRFQKVALWWEERRGVRKRLKPSEWWAKSG